MSGGRRLDVALVEDGHFETRERARAAIMAGQVSIDGKRETKAGTRVADGANLTVQGDRFPYVSRGGLKLAKALAVFPISPAARVAIDVGASTGGFTDCLLKAGARLVYAVDVGYGQLAWSLRQDPRVVVLERTNIRYLDASLLTERPDLATVDTSFISVTKYLEHLIELLATPADLVVLVKPQFEAGRAEVGKRGVVRDPKVHHKVIMSVAAAAQALGVAPAGVSYSPVVGPEGNIEFLLHLRKEGPTAVQAAPLLPDCFETVVERVVTEAHAVLTKEKESSSV